MNLDLLEPDRSEAADELRRWELHFGKTRLKERTFLLGNKQAFSLALPAAAGPTPTLLHAHKWYGAFHYGRKYLEGQAVRLADGRMLSGRLQVGLTAGLTSVRREYEVDGTRCDESYFVPDGVLGIACTFEGEIGLIIEPEFDIRFSRALGEGTAHYSIEPIERGVIVSNVLPAGTYDDLTETFLPSGEDVAGQRVFAAVQVSLDTPWTPHVEFMPPGRRARRKLFRKDAQRSRFLRHSGDDVADHAPLWDRVGSTVYVPVRLHLPGPGTVLYGFGSSREEAISQLDVLHQHLPELQREKKRRTSTTLAHARFETGNERADTAYAQILTRLMDSLVARNAVAESTGLPRPATMILAGNQYFHDSWKRDENIALGFLLALGFYDLARDVVADTWQLQDPITGRLPQRIRTGEEPPYHSSDGTLWAVWRLHGYWRCSGDNTLLNEKLPMVQLFFRRSIERLRGGMLPSGRTHGAYLWETWMDTPHTPRDGFPVEIQMLWIACLRVFRPIIEKVDPELEPAMERAEREAWQALQRFYIRSIPADSLDDSGVARDLLTPNPYFCFGIGLDLGAEVEASMRDLGRDQFAGRQGIVTLAPLDWERVFSPEFLENPRAVRGRRMRSMGKFNYHRGVEWNWLAHFFVRSELKYGEPDVAFRRYLRGQIEGALDNGGIGGVSELYDLSGVRGPEFQAWSMSGVLEALHAFAGISVDVPDQKITVEPQSPRSWSKIEVRKWYGRVPFDVRYTAHSRGQWLLVEWPERQPPDARIEVVLTLPPNHAVQVLDVRLDGVPAPVAGETFTIAGTRRDRLQFTVPAHAHVEVVVATRRTAGRRWQADESLALGSYESGSTTTRRNASA